MKNITITVILLLVVTCVNAQTNKGNILAGASLRYEAVTPQTILPLSGDTKQRSIAFGPQLGYFVAPNFAVGIQGEYSHYKYLSGLGNELKVTNWTVGPFARYYIYISDDKFAFFMQAIASIGGGKSTGYIAGNVEKSTAFNASISPGLAYFFNTHWALDVYVRGAYFARYKGTGDTLSGVDETITYGGLSLNSLNPSLGIRYHFGG